MFSALKQRAAKGFLKELDQLAARRAGPDTDEDPVQVALREANTVLEQVLKPLFQGYVDVLKARGISCGCKFNGATLDGFGFRLVTAEFMIGLYDVPGVADCFMRFEHQGDGWEVVSMPGLTPKWLPGDIVRIKFPMKTRSENLFEGLLQEFIRRAL